LLSFERVTDRITHGDVSAMRPIAEDLRLQYKEAFARRQPASSTLVYLSYTPEDLMWVPRSAGAAHPPPQGAVALRQPRQGQA
jgi:hypothetical protein